MKIALSAAALYVVMFSALRLAFLWTFSDSVGSAGELLEALYLGFKFDLRLAVLLSAPMLLAAIPLLDPARRAAARRLWIVYFTTVLAGLMVVYAADFGHYGYTHTRVHGAALEHLTPVEVALPMVWQSYPVVWVVAGVVLACALCAWLLQRVALSPRASGPRGLRRLAAVAILALLSLAALWGKWSWYPLRWSDAYFSQDPFVSALALNPVLFLAETLDERQRPFDEDKVRQHYDEVAGLLGLTQLDPERRSFARRAMAAVPSPERPPNLVLIHLESFAGYKAGALGNASGATPHFDALAREGMLFTNFFVPNSPTARSVFTMLTGVPDYHPGRSASRNPLLVKQHTLVNALAGYDRYYFLGGSASWANIRGLLTQSIDNLQVHEEGDYTAERVDVWGVTDHDVFERAHSAFSRSESPFFAFIQTSGNHRPYTIPETNRRGFEATHLDEDALHAAGFDSLAAYNGLRFLDHAIGYFFRMARRAPYFGNTVFILYGDHGNPAPHDIPWERLGLTRYHVPMLIVAPGRITPEQRVDTVASSVDLLPTALGLMGIPHLNKTLGRDLLAPRPAAYRVALVPDGLLTDEYLMRLTPQGQAQLYAYRSKDPTTDLGTRLPDTARGLRRLREGLYEASLYLLHHNAPQAHMPPTAYNKPH